ncbi:MAG TPA: DUF928 domain-containing protein [Leptolyngbya sp.]|jgi:hypothetical protein|nr:DUF928 domain-containing protein [Leptolyngbya sp.]
MKSRFRLLTLLPLTLSLTLGTAINLLASSAAIAQFKLPTPPNRGAAGNRRGAASRGDCEATPERLTALVPEYAKTVQGKKLPSQVWGLTAAARPMLWFYQPYAKASIASLQVILRDEANRSNPVIYRASLPPAQTSGIQGVALTDVPLDVNKTYHWYLKLTMNCTVPEPIFAEGWVQRVPLDAPASLAVYAEKGIWYDAIATVAQSRQTNPTDPALLQDWTNLLQSIQLDSIASQPFVKPTNR